MPFSPETSSRGLSAGGMVKALRHYGASRHNQRKSPFFVVEGYRVCREALLRRPSWFSFCLLSEAFSSSPEGEEFRGLLSRLGFSWGSVSPGEFSGLALTEGSQGVIVAMERPSFGAPERLSPVCTLILDQVREPGNVGTLLRTAWAAGLEQVWLTAGSADPWNPKVIRSGMGAQFALETRLFPDLDAAAETFRALGGREIWCAMMEAPTTLFSPDFTPAGAALVLGNEGNGITRPQVGRPVTIPMPGHAESLNVAQAGTLLLFEALRRRPPAP
ncbi:MAG: TrmH family RNA methyltransferase [Oligosphaeraceae bacterium]